MAGGRVAVADGVAIVWCSMRNRRTEGHKRAPIKDNNDNHVHTRNDGPERTRRPSVQVIRHPAADANTQYEAAISRGTVAGQVRVAERQHVNPYTPPATIHRH